VTAIASSNQPPPTDAGAHMHALVAELFPLCRSITGNGVRQTLRRLQQEIPLTIHEVRSGTPVLDWTVPDEWNVRGAYIANSRGERVVDFERGNLHLVSYSRPVHTTLSLAELKPHLHTLPDQPQLIPYRTTYYEDNWGFCLAQAQLEALPEDNYEVRVDTSLQPGSLTYGELRIQGATDDEILISAHCCHPSLANDNLSGIAVAVALAQFLSRVHNRYSYRFIFAPATIGAITWLARNQDIVPRIRHGIVLSCVGDEGMSTYKRSRHGSATVDRAVEHVLRHSNESYRVLPFEPYGYDERQYCSPGFNLPVGCLMRTPNSRFPEYHTSADHVDFVKPHALQDTLGKLHRVIELIERDRSYVNLFPYGEPQLGRRGLYEGSRGVPHLHGYELALLWVLNLSDGSKSLLDIAEQADLPFSVILRAAERLEAARLLAPAAPSVPTAATRMAINQGAIR